MMLMILILIATFYWVPILPLGRVLIFFFTHSIWFILTKSKEEKIFKIPVSKTIELDGSVGIQTQEYIDPK